MFRVIPSASDLVLNSYGIIGSGQRGVSKWIDRCMQEIIGGG